MALNRPPTQHDVARRAGVSTATVSYILSGRPNRANPATAETRARVLAAARDLGYQRNHAARTLRRRRTDVVAVVHRPPSSPWADRLVHQLHEAALHRGYSVITMPVGAEEAIDTALRSLREQHVDGAILTPPHHLPVDELATLARNGLALVVFDDAATPDGFDVVRNNQAAACYQAVDHLVQRGHRRIAFFAHPDPDGAPGRDAKYEGYRRALTDHGLPIDRSLVFAVADSRPHAFRLTGELLRRDDAPTAIFSASDRGALAAIWAAQQRGATVPGDLAVVGVGNTDEGEVISPALTTVGSAGFEFSAIVERLFDRVTTDRPLSDTELHQTWELFVRQST